MTVQNTAENAERCMCPACPTYNDCMSGAGELLFCARGKTDCAPTPVTCSCGGCTVWAVNKLNSYYYCMKGAAS